MSTKIQIVIADDEQLFRKGMRFLLEKNEEFEIIFEAEDGNQLIERLKESETTPDIILMDLKMPNLNGVEGN